MNQGGNSAALFHARFKKQRTPITVAQNVKPITRARASFRGLGRTLPNENTNMTN
jgi:hypothetical protein